MPSYISSYIPAEFWLSTVYVGTFLNIVASEIAKGKAWLNLDPFAAGFFA